MDKFESKIYLNIGMIGTGFMTKTHSNAYHTMKYIYNKNVSRPVLKAIHSVSNISRAEEAKERYGFERAGVGYESLVDSPDIDVVDICVGDELHYEIAMAAVKAGKHVVCEKPLATCREKAKEMDDAAKASSVLALCGFNYRFVPAVMLTKQLIDSGVMGTVYNFEGSYMQDVGFDPCVPYEKLWYATGPKSSGVAYGIGCHLFDMARFLVGEVEYVSGDVANYNPYRLSSMGSQKVISPENVSAVVGFKNGASGSLRVSAAAAGRKNRLYYEISCSKGSIVFDLEEINYLKIFFKDSPVKQISGFTKINVTQVDKDHPFMDAWWPRGHGIGWEHAHINELSVFLECVAKKSELNPLAASFHDGYMSLKIADAILESADNGQRIFVDSLD